jgi:hypothetical protein
MTNPKDTWNKIDKCINALEQAEYEFSSETHLDKDLVYILHDAILFSLETLRGIKNV